MNEEILKLAKECGLEAAFDLQTEQVMVRFWKGSVEAFYRAAFKQGLEAAAKKFDGEVFAYDYRELAAAIRALEKKP